MPEQSKNAEACGIAAEYNPFHNGHLWHLAQTRSNFPRARERAVVIAALSANFVQRGLPSIIDKWARTKMALESGVDLVVELPAFFSCNSGMAFAQGAVDTLNAVRVSHISFGAETDSVSQLETLARILSQESATFKQTMKNALSNGASYSKAAAAALEAESAGAGEIASSPNNILALSYLAHINKKNYGILPLPIKRRGGGHNESAASIRKSIRSREELREFLPASSLEIMDKCLRDGRIADGDSKLFDLLRLTLLRSERGSLGKIAGMEEGLEGLFAGNIARAGSFEDFIGRCVCARYTRGRLQRQVIKILLGVDKWTDAALQRTGARYVRVLGYNGAGRRYLRDISKTAGLEIVTRLAAVSDPLGKALAQIEFRASALWEILCGSRVKVREADMRPIEMG